MTNYQYRQNFNEFTPKMNFHSDINQPMPGARTSESRHLIDDIKNYIQSVSVALQPISPQLKTTDYDPTRQTFHRTPWPSETPDTAAHHDRHETRSLLTETINVHDVIEKMLPMLRIISGAAVEVLHNAKRHGTTIICNAEALETVILDLIMNARRTMPGGGVIEIDAFVEINPSEAQGYEVCIEVRDDGHGMSEYDLETSRQHRFTTQTRRDHRGSRLSSIRQFAANAAGRLEVRSEPWVGTEVRLYLPGAHGRFD